MFNKNYTIYVIHIYWNNDYGFLKKHNISQTNKMNLKPKSIKILHT